MEEQKEYYAFISYKREDEKWAKWLQHKLEHYRFPTNLSGRNDLPKRIFPICRDVTEFTPGLLAEKIEKALCNSEWLIIVCSPRSAKSPWVCKEAQTFIDLGRTDHIIPFVIEGNPFSKDTATECYPEALLNLTGSQELLAANINEMGRDAASIKVVAQMFNLKFDTLWQRYKREQRNKHWFRGFVFLLVSLVLIALGWMGYNYLVNNAKEIAQEALSLDAMGDSFSARRKLQKVIKFFYPYVPEVEIALRKIMGNDNMILHTSKSVGHINDVCFDSKGECLAVAGSNSIEIWDLKSGKISQKFDNLSLGQMDSNRPSSISCIEFYPIPSKKIVVTANWSGNILFRNTDTGKGIFSLNGHKGKILSICFNRNGSRLISTATDSSLIVWDVYKKSIIKRIPVPEFSQCIKYNSQETKIVFANEDSLFVLDLKSMNLMSKPHGHKCHWINSISFSKDDNYLTTSSDRGEIKVWNAKSLECIDTFEGNFSGFQNDGTILYYSRDGLIKKKDVLSKNVIDSIHVGVANTNIFVLSPDGSKVVLLEEADHSIRIVDVRFCQLPEKISGTSNRTTIVSINANKDLLLFESENNEIGLWNLNTIECIRSFSVKNIKSASISPDGKDIAVVRDSTIRIFEIATGKEKCTIQDTCRLDKIIYCPDGENVITGVSKLAINENVKKWNVSNKKCEQHANIWLSSALWNGYCPLIYHHPNNGRIYAINNLGNFLFFWDYTNSNSDSNERFAVDVNQEHKGDIYDIAFSYNGKEMASASEDKSVILWDLEYRKLKQTFLHPAGVNSLCFISDFNHIATSDGDGVIRIWDIVSGKCLYCQSFGKPAIDIYFSESEKTIIGITRDGYIIRIPYHNFNELKDKLKQWCN